MSAMLKSRIKTIDPIYNEDVHVNKRRKRSAEVPYRSKQYLKDHFISTFSNPNFKRSSKPKCDLEKYGGCILKYSIKTQCKDKKSNTIAKMWKSDPLLNDHKEYANSEPYEFRIPEDGYYYLYGQLLFNMIGNSQPKFNLSRISDKNPKNLVSCSVGDDNHRANRERMCFTSTVAKLRKGEKIAIVSGMIFAFYIYDFQNRLDEFDKLSHNVKEQCQCGKDFRPKSNNRTRRGVNSLRLEYFESLKKKFAKCRRKRKQVRKELELKKTGGLHLTSEFSQLDAKSSFLIAKDRICRKGYGGCLINRVEFKTTSSLSVTSSDIAVRMWKKEFEWGNVASLENGEIRIKKPGIYQVYAQLTYLDRTKSWSFHVDRMRHTTFSSEDGRSLMKCLFRDLRPNSKSRNEQSCFTSVIMKLETNDTLVLKNYYADRSIAVHSSLSFWGVIRLNGAL
ncbi:DgyrCDS3368 [Dimorphilus gyrociliatus]|uniref:DgyrCDS3368 n=1 Tax=Dimorphilus gyrociliatus TaxID=2664684 RepID=A0A7I8VDK0_9ANNE|nr:DgyrCDS3368 [Dimorphilus gyrociliatus]